MPEINAICDNEIESESEQVISELETGWSPKNTWSSSIKVGSMESIEARPRRRGTSRPLAEIFKYNDDSKGWDRIQKPPDYKPPDSLPAFQAICWTEADHGVDYRPHLFDPDLKQHLLVDSKEKPIQRKIDALQCFLNLPNKRRSSPSWGL